MFSRRFFVILPFALALVACHDDADPATLIPEGAGYGSSAMDALSASGSAAVNTVAFPEDDPGPPLYARVTAESNQIFSNGEYVAIPFYRDPDCVPRDFDLFQALHLPGPDGPGAFACPLTVSGRLLIESDAAPGTFPIRVIARGPTPVWLVPWSDFQAATADGDFTMAELVALEPLRGIADPFHEMLSPRPENHHVVITSRGRLDDGRSFLFNVNHRGDQTQSILIRIQ